MIDLRYLYTNRYTTPGFKEKFESYIEQLIKENPLSTVNEGIAQTVEQIEKSPAYGFSLTPNLKTRFELMASAIIDWTEYYWTLVPSDKVAKNKCLAWLDYACQMNPYNEKIPVKALNLLYRLKQKKVALKYLNDALKAQERIGVKDEKILNMLKSKIASVEKDKE